MGICVAYFCLCSIKITYENRMHIYYNAMGVQICCYSSACSVILLRDLDSIFSSVDGIFPACNFIINWIFLGLLEVLRRRSKLVFSFEFWHFSFISVDEERQIQTLPIFLLAYWEPLCSINSYYVVYYDESGQIVIHNFDIGLSDMWWLLSRNYFSF